MYDLTAYDIASRDISMLMDVDTCAIRCFPRPRIRISDWQVHRWVV